jgi:hypothetical protein
MRPVLRAMCLALALPAPAFAGGDFNGDGFDDAAIAAPLDPVLGAPTGSVSVVYGNGYGLDTIGSPPEQFLTAFHFGLVPNLADGFGSALALGDFDGDGFGDLAVGIPEREVEGFADAGAVGVVYGGVFGLDPDRTQLFTQATKGIKDDPEGGDEFGCGVAAGDFNGDGRDDLAIGACSEGVGALEHAGAVHVLRGSKKGLRAGKNQLWTREALLGAGTPSTLFGSTFAVGDFSGDGFEDIAIGGWLTETDGVSTGAVDVLLGSKKGLAAAGHTELEPTTLLGVEPDSLFFGRALAAGDFDANGADDLAIGAPGTDVGGLASAGATHVVYGVPGTGLDLGSLESWDEVVVPTGGFDAYDDLGAALAAGDFDSDGRDDLAIAVPFATVAGVDSAGELIVLRGANPGLITSGVEIWSQDTADVVGATEADQCGRGLASGDYDGDGAQDLLVGCPGESVGELEYAGTVVALYGEEGGSGLTADGNEALTRGEAVEGVASAEARFGGVIGN